MSEVRLPALIAALCAGLADDDGPLAAEGPVREAALAAVESARASAGDLPARLAAVESALRAAGLPHGLRAGDYRAADPGPSYSPLRGLQSRGVHSVLRCPADPPLRCARLERATWAMRAARPQCAVFDLPFAEETVTFR
jgi:hypothetical protein